MVELEEIRERIMDRYVEGLVIFLLEFYWEVDNFLILNYFFFIWFFKGFFFWVLEILNEVVVFGEYF